MNSPPLKPFRTSDLGLASFLKSKRHPLKELQPSEDDEGRLEFIFDLPEDEGERLARDYLNRSAQADAMTLVEEIGLLKSLIFKYKRKNGGIE